MFQFRWITCWFAVLALLGAGSAFGQWSARPPAVPPVQERRIALVIGNGNYSFGKLRNAANDARAMADTLRDLGFEVDLRENASLRSTLDALREFALKAPQYDVRLLFYAGHGMQLRGKNYLVPVDAEILGEEDVPARSADVNELMERLARISKGLNIIILDACRTNPFVEGGGVLLADGRRVKLRSVVAPKGLAPLDAPVGTLVAFSTAPNASAKDGENGRNGVYTKHLLAHIATPGLAVEQLFKRVRLGVMEETKREQVPWESSSLTGEFCFRPVPGAECAATPPMVPVRKSGSLLR
jgi:uncharacterized caspase-like protein